MKDIKQINWLLKELPNLVKVGILNEDKVKEIENHYKLQLESHKPLNLAFIIFAIIGVIFIGGGILSIIAFNWSAINKEFKTVLALLPTLIAQLIGWFVFKKKMESIAWRESMSVFLFICLAASITLIGQIYHLASDYSSFILSLGLMSLPIIYIFRSSALVALSSGFIIPCFSNIENSIIFVIGICPFLYKVFQNKYSPSSYFLSIAMSVLWLFNEMFWTFSSCVDHNYCEINKFGKIINGICVVFLFFVGTLYFNDNKKHPLRIIGALGLFFTSYLSVFKSTQISNISNYPAISFNIVFLILMVIGTIYLIKTVSSDLFISEWCLLVYPIVALIEILIIKSSSTQSFLISTLYNLYFLLLAVSIIIKGNNTKELNIIATGSFLITLYIITKFISIQSDLITKGLICILIGAGFLGFNFYMKKTIERGEKI